MVYSTKSLLAAYDYSDFILLPSKIILSSIYIVSCRISSYKIPSAPSRKLIKIVIASGHYHKTEITVVMYAIYPCVVKKMLMVNVKLLHVRQYFNGYPGLYQEFIEEVRRN